MHAELISSVAGPRYRPPVQSPRVRDHSWGNVDVELVGGLVDAKLWPGGGREWDDAYNELADRGVKVAALIHSTC